jgi:hypothetical protein
MKYTGTCACCGCSHRSKKFKARPTGFTVTTDLLSHVNTFRQQHELASITEDALAKLRACGSCHSRLRRVVKPKNNDTFTSPPPRNARSYHPRTRDSATQTYASLSHHAQTLWCGWPICFQRIRPGFVYFLLSSGNLEWENLRNQTWRHVRLTCWPGSAIYNVWVHMQSFL